MTFTDQPKTTSQQMGIPVCSGGVFHFRVCIYIYIYIYIVPFIHLQFTCLLVNAVDALLDRECTAITYIYFSIIHFLFHGARVELCSYIY